MRTALILFATMLLGLPVATAATDAVEKDPFTFGAPDGWRAERIPFPLDFAPSLAYVGFEELRFAPGMFDPKSDTYFTYVFFWWVEGKTAPTHGQLQKDLVVYFKGLSEAVGEAKKLKIDTSTVTALVTPIHSSGSPGPMVQYRGVVETPDPFNGGLIVSLNMEIGNWYCETAQRTCVFFCVSPQRYEREEWNTLWAIRSSFRCSAP